MKLLVLQMNEKIIMSTSPLSQLFQIYHFHTNQGTGHYFQFHNAALT